MQGPEITAGPLISEGVQHYFGPGGQNMSKYLGVEVFGLGELYLASFFVTNLTVAFFHKYIHNNIFIIQCGRGPR